MEWILSVLDPSWDRSAGGSFEYEYENAYEYDCEQVAHYVSAIMK